MNMNAESPLPSSLAVIRPRWWHRFDSLRAKLFLAIAGANMLLVVVAYLIYGWSFDRGLLDYLNRADDARLAPLVQRLSAEYSARGSWQWLAENPEALHRVLHDSLAPILGENIGKPAWVEGRLFVVDADRKLVVGDAEKLDEAWLMPIVARGSTVGYIGRTPRRELVESMEQATSARQGRQFAVIALAMLAAVALNAALISRWLGRRLAALGVAAAAVAQGDYSHRLPLRGNDELARLAGDFNHMAASLEAAREARQRWIADIAHELRTPLASLRAEIEALQDGVRAPTPERMDSLAQETLRLTRLVDDLRLLSLSDLGALDYRFEKQDIGELIADYLDEARLPEGWQMQREIASGIVMRADDDRLVQVLANLLQNTARYTDAPGRLRVGLRRVGNEALLRWEDSAPGVPLEALARLTERLYRVDDSRARDSGGSGLGLAIVRAIVEGHGGRMVASASDLGGLRWDIFLPLESA
jgi:two-component system sensor histidine kinase BaeS